MKKIILIVFIISIGVIKGFAQGPPKENAPKKTPEERAENMTKRLTKELALNPEQRVKAKAIILKREQERENKMKENREDREKINSEFKTFLTEDQFKKLIQKEEEMKKKRAEQRKQSPPPKDSPQPANPEGK